MADLEESAPIASLMEEIKVHDHLALMYQTPEERNAVMVPYLAAGCKAGERCLYLGPASGIKSALEILRKGGVDTCAELERGALVTWTDKDVLETRDPSGAGLIRLFAEAAAEARKAGYASLRICDEKSWVFQSGFSREAMIEYEAEMNNLVGSQEVTALCMYDLASFPLGMLQDVIRTHPRIIVRNRMCRNVLYLPPDKLFRADTEEAQVKMLLQELLRNEELLMEKTLFKAVFENSADAIFVEDLQGRYLLVNPALAAIYNKRVDQIVGHTAGELLPLEEAAKIAAAESHALIEEMPIKLELTLTSGGSLRTYSTIKGVHRNAKGEISGIFGITRDITEQKELELKLADYREQLRYLASELSLVEERQRRAIASTLHDQIGQALALAKIRLDTARSKLAEMRPEEMEKELDDIGAVLKSVIRQSRTLTEEVSPTVLYTAGLEAAIEALAKEYRQRHGIEIVFEADGAAKPLDDDLRGLLFQSVRELLVNVIKHARASRVRIQMRRDGDFARISVADNGSGFHGNGDTIRAGAGVGYGLFRIRERLLYAGGCFDLDSAPGQGTCVTLVAPLSAASAAREKKINKPRATLKG